MPYRRAPMRRRRRRRFPRSRTRRFTRRFPRRASRRLRDTRGPGLLSAGGHVIMPKEITRPMISSVSSAAYSSSAAAWSGEITASFDLSNMLAPLSGHTGNVPYGRNEIGSFFNHYRVMSADWSIRLKPSALFDSTATDGLYLVYWYATATGKLGSTPTAEALRNGMETLEGERVFYKRLQPYKYDVQNPPREIHLRGSLDCWRLKGSHFGSVSEYINDSATEAVFTVGSVASPTKHQHLFWGLLTANNAVPAANNHNMWSSQTIRQHVHLHQRARISQS